MKHTSAKTEYPQTCIHKLVEAVVELSPDAVAVVFEQESLTYRQLNSRANFLAHHLQALEVRREVLVGICMERSLELVVGLLGILKAGGAYVPLDPAYPTEQLALMLEDTYNLLLSALMFPFRKSSLLGVQAERSVLISQQVRV